jgi:hypothetical protein
MAESEGIKGRVKWFWKYPRADLWATRQAFIYCFYVVLGRKILPYIDMPVSRSSLFAQRSLGAKRVAVWLSVIYLRVEKC